MAYKIQKHAQAVVENPYVKVPIRIVYPVTADASSGLAIFDGDCPSGFYITGVSVIATATNASGTLKLTDGTNDITDTIACATDKAVDYAATIDDAYYDVLKNGTLKVVANGAADRGIVVIDGHLI